MDRQARRLPLQTAGRLMIILDGVVSDQATFLVAFGGPIGGQGVSLRG